MAIDSDSLRTGENFAYYLIKGLTKNNDINAYLGRLSDLLRLYIQ